MFEHFFSIKCAAAGMTDTGQIRKHNEDNICLNNDINLFIVADGMGGHESGEVASKMATKIVESALKKQSQQTKKMTNDIEIAEVSAIIKAIEKTNNTIHQANQAKGLVKGKGMGTTIVGCWYLIEQKLSVIFNVGDSRAYSYHKQKLVQITTDHSLLQLWKDECFDGDKPSANVLTKALGPYEDVTPDVVLYPNKKNEKILLCSDGLTTMLNDEKILEILIKYEDSPENIPDKLISHANLAGGDDNISVIIINFM
jgi:protein phosphatase